MIPIHELLNKIRWNSEFGKGTFEIGYFDRVAQKIMRVAFKNILLEKGNHATFQLMDANGELL